MEFSKSEEEILDLLCEGLSNREIADKRFTTESTTKAHLLNIYKKMGLKGKQSRIKAILIYKEMMQ